MTKNAKPGDGKSGGAAAAREARLAKALRENLKRRKAQAREREDGGAKDGSGERTEKPSKGEA